MNLPTPQQCEQLFVEYKVPRDTIYAHCQAVQKVAMFLAENLIKQGYPLHIVIVRPLALLHDFMKVVVLERLLPPLYPHHTLPEETAMHQQIRKRFKGKSETYAAYTILKEKYPEFALLFLGLDKLTRNPAAIVPEEVHFIHYVDWRVLETRIVSMGERLTYIWNRYHHWMEENQIDWEATKEKQFQYEQKIFNHLAFLPAQLAENVKL